MIGQKLRRRNHPGIMAIREYHRALMFKCACPNTINQISHYIPRLTSWILDPELQFQNTATNDETQDFSHNKVTIILKLAIPIYGGP